MASTTVLTVVPGYKADKIKRMEEFEEPEPKPAYRVYFRNAAGLLQNDGITYRGWNAARSAAMALVRNGLTTESQVMYG